MAQIVLWNTRIASLYFLADLDWSRPSAFIAIIPRSSHILCIFRGSFS